MSEGIHEVKIVISPDPKVYQGVQWTVWSAEGEIFASGNVTPKSRWRSILRSGKPNDWAYYARRCVTVKGYRIDWSDTTITPYWEPPEGISIATTIRSIGRKS